MFVGKIPNMVNILKYKSGKKKKHFRDIQDLVS